MVTAFHNPFIGKANIHKRYFCLIAALPVMNALNLSCFNLMGQAIDDFTKDLNGSCKLTASNPEPFCHNFKRFQNGFAIHLKVFFCIIGNRNRRFIYLNERYNTIGDKSEIITNLLKIQNCLPVLNLCLIYFPNSRPLKAVPL